MFGIRTNKILKNKIREIERAIELYSKEHDKADEGDKEFWKHEVERHKYISRVLKEIRYGSA